MGSSFDLVTAILCLAMVMAGVKGQGCSPYQGFANHTMCLYSSNACPGSNLIRSDQLTCLDKKEILKAHNDKRKSVANGLVAGQPRAANMLEMLWDEELAEIAQRWADQCNFANDQERSVARFRVGQNIYIIDGIGPVSNETLDWNYAVSSWFNQVFSAGVNASNVDPFKFVPETKFYTQVVWATSYTVGCGYTSYVHGRFYSKLFICNYGPGGNVEGPGQKIYEIGPTNCGTNTPSSNYPGMCIVPGADCWTLRC